MFNVKNPRKNKFMLHGSFAFKGYDWWWHNFTGVNVATGEEKAFFVEYFMCNPALAEEKPVLGQAKESKRYRKKPSYVMVKAGCWGEKPMQLHRFFAWNQVLLHKGAPFSLQADDCKVNDEMLTGSIKLSESEVLEHPEYMCDAGEMSWNLTVDKQVAFNVGYGTSRAPRVAKSFEMYWHAEGMKSAYLGTVTCNGEIYQVSPKNSYGYADKNWGRNFTSPWIWLSSNHMVSKVTGKTLKDSVFDIGGGRPKVYHMPFEQKLLGAFWYEGMEFEYNFSKPHLETKTDFNCYETKSSIVWKIRQENYNSIMYTYVTCPKKEMLLVNYESPDGCKRHNRLWNGGTGKGRIKLYEKVSGCKVLIDDIAIDHVGCEWGEYGKE